MSGDGSEGARAGLEESLGMEDAEGGGGGTHALLRPQFSRDNVACVDWVYVAAHYS